ncbi:Hypothetical protein A7982_08707 [Minicystis rosea]|nr:Hypothetical protein A7982_08707 [Minicystis rosea]
MSASRWLAAGLALVASITAAPSSAAGRRGPRAAVATDATDASSVPSATPAASSSLRRVRGGMHLEVKARDLRLRDTDEERLRRIAARYFKATRKRLVVTGGTRTPERQATLMIAKLRHGDDIMALYENKAAATEIKNAYRAVSGKPQKQVQKAIVDVIRGQISRGIYVSKHLQSGAVDVRSWGMAGPQERALRDAVKEEPGVSMLDERSGPEPHFHLNLAN